MIAVLAQSREVITEEDIFDALENIHMEKVGRGGQTTEYEEDIIPPLMRRHIAVYEAGKAILGCITPDFDELSKVGAF